MIVYLLTCNMIQGHARLIEPAGRSTAFRYGFDTPANYNDNQLFCGGVPVSYSLSISYHTYTLIPDLHTVYITKLSY